VSGFLVGNALVGAYLRDLGLGYKAISFMTRKDPMSLEWLTPDLAKDLEITLSKLSRSTVVDELMRPDDTRQRSVRHEFRRAPAASSVAMAMSSTAAGQAASPD
jgi:hypothetical protein